MSFRVPEKYRVARPVRDSFAFASNPGDLYGMFVVPTGSRSLRVIACDGAADPECPPESYGWEHVSVSVAERGGVTRSNLPTWYEMEEIKQLFWEPEDCVVQFHPPKSEYVNKHPVLHLWRWTNGSFPRPPKVLV